MLDEPVGAGAGDGLRAAHAVALHLLVVGRVGVHDVLEEAFDVLLFDGRLFLERGEDAECLLKSVTGVEPLYLGRCGERDGLRDGLAHEGGGSIHLHDDKTAGDLAGRPYFPFGCGKRQ